MRRESYPHTQGWTRITRLQIPSEARDAIHAWNIGDILACTLVKRGVVNHNFIIRTPQGKHVLRQVSQAHHRSLRDLKFEISYLDYLKQSNFPYTTPSAIPTKNGSLFVTVRGHYYWLYKFLEGRIVERLDRSHLAQLAQMMARYHALIERSNLHNGKPNSDPYGRAATLKEIEEYRAVILRKKSLNRQERTFLEWSAKLTQILRGLGTLSYSDLELYPIHRDLELYPIHRDLISENLLWKEGKLAGVIDFEHVSGSNDPIVKDIAVTMQYCCRDNKARYRLDIDSARRFLQSYMESHPLPDREIALIPDLMTAGFLDDFAYAYWMLRNDPVRAKRSEADGYGLALFSKAAQWNHRNRKSISQALLE